MIANALQNAITEELAASKQETNAKPSYPPDDGPLTDEQIAAIKKATSKQEPKACKRCGGSGEDQPYIAASHDGPEQPAALCASCNGSGWASKQEPQAQAEPEVVAVADGSFNCNAGLGQELITLQSHREAMAKLKAERRELLIDNERLRGKAATAEKWKGIAEAMGSKQHREAAAMLEAQPAEQANGREAVAVFKGRRLTPFGTREFWGWLSDGVEDLPDGTPLYTTPPAQPAREWVGLTEPERLQIVQNHCLNVGNWTQNGRSVSVAVESKLREKNAGQHATIKLVSAYKADLDASKRDAMDDARRFLADTGIDAGENPPNKTLYVIMARHGLNMVVGEDMKRLLDYGRDVWRKATADKAGGDDHVRPAIWVNGLDLSKILSGDPTLRLDAMPDEGMRNARYPDGSKYYDTPLYTRPQPQAAVPDGYVLVPVEPTREMIKAGARCASSNMCWREMLADAPKPQEAGQ